MTGFCNVFAVGDMASNGDGDIVAAKCDGIVNGIGKNVCSIERKLVGIYGDIGSIPIPGRNVSVVCDFVLFVL